MLDWMFFFTSCFLLFIFYIKFSSFWMLLPLYLLLSLLIAFLVFLLICFLGCLIMTNLRINHNFKGFLIRDFSIFLLKILRIKVVIKNDHLIPSQDKLIFYVNHKSKMDAFIILSAIVKRNLSFTPKDVLYRYFLMSFVFNSFNCIKIVRNDNRTTFRNIMKGIINIQKGLAVVIFPEGGINRTNPTEKVHNLLPGAFKIAFQSQATILPLTIKGSSKIKKMKWFQRKNIEIYCHEPIKFEHYNSYNTHQIATKIENIVNSVF